MRGNRGAAARPGSGERVSCRLDDGAHVGDGYCDGRGARSGRAGATTCGAPQAAQVKAWQWSVLPVPPPTHPTHAPATYIPAPHQTNGSTNAHAVSGSAQSELRPTTTTAHAVFSLAQSEPRSTPTNAHVVSCSAQSELRPTPTNAHAVFNLAQSEP